MAGEVGQLLQQWLADARALAVQHAHLARGEFSAWAERVGPHAAVALLLLPGIAVGLLLVGVGAALALGRYVPLPLAFLLAVLLAAAPGVVSLAVLARALRRAPPPLAATRAEMKGTLEALRTAGARA